MVSDLFRMTRKSPKRLFVSSTDNTYCYAGFDILENVIYFVTILLYRTSVSVGTYSQLLVQDLFRVAKSCMQFFLFVFI
jgi:hypothetical protein